MAKTAEKQETAVVVAPVVRAVASIFDGHGSLLTSAIQNMVHRLFNAMPVDLHDLPRKLMAITLVEYTAPITESGITSGRDMEVGALCRPLLNGAYSRYAYVVGKEARLAKGEVTNDTGKVFDSSTSGSALVACGIANSDDSVYDGFTFDNERYNPSRSEATYDIECLVRVIAHVARLPGCSFVANSFIGSDGQIIHMAPSWDAWRKEANRREKALDLQIADDLKTGVEVNRRTPMGEDKRAGLMEEGEFDASCIGINEAFEGVARLLALVGFDDDIGKSVTNAAGRKQVVKLLYGLNNRSNAQVKSAMKYVGLMGQSPDGIAILNQLRHSPEWRAEVERIEDEREAAEEDKRLREQKAEDKKAERERNAEVREANKRMDEARRMAARLNHAKLMAVKQAEIDALLAPAKKEPPVEDIEAKLARLAKLEAAEKARKGSFYR